MRLNNSKFNLLLSVLFLVNFLAGSQDFSVLSISDDLKQNANAVIRSEKTTVTVQSEKKMLVRNRLVVSVFNEYGNRSIIPSEFYNSDTKISHLYLEVFDAFGNSIQKFSKSKFKDRSAVSGADMYSDDRVKYIDFKPTEYPYTAIFESEYSTSSTALIPSWFPLKNYSVSIERSEYEFSNPNNYDVRIKERQFGGFTIKKSNTDNLNYSLLNQKALKYERLGPPIVDIVPTVSVALNVFSLKGVRGYATNWEEFGAWMNKNLLANKTELNPATVSEVKDLIKDTDDQYLQAKRIYEYMQDKTRYISVQDGIGGWEPMPAKEVEKLGYGDCKALTVYTKALMESVDIEANYVLVYAGNRRDIDTDFASIQGNHAILNLPNIGKDVWLECTNQDLPFGFLSGFTSNRDVLVISSNGAKIKQTPAYLNETNSQSISGTINLKPNGDVLAQIKIESRGLQYANEYQKKNISPLELNEEYLKKRWGYLNNLKIEEVVLNEDKGDVSFGQALTATIGEYANFTEDEYSFKLNIFNRNDFIPRRYRKRQTPLVIDSGFCDIDDIKINIPLGYSITNMLENIHIESKFGVYELSVEPLDNNSIRYKRTLKIKQGVYSAEDYELYRQFRKKIAQKEHIKVILNRKKT